MDIAKDFSREDVMSLCDEVRQYLIENGYNAPKVSWEEISRQSDKVLYGPHDAGWLAFYNALVDFDLPDGKYIPNFVEVSKLIGWWIPYDEVALISAPPTRYLLDENDEFHSEDGPALEYSDGLKFYCVHGVKVPAWVIENPEKITVKDIQKENNAEIKRIMREKYGEGNYLRDIGAKVIHVDTVFVDRVAKNGPAVPRALLEDDTGNRFLVGTDGSSDRVYYMRCRNDPLPNTCEEAHSQLMPFGSDGDILCQS